MAGALRLSSPDLFYRRDRFMSEVERAGIQLFLVAFVGTQYTLRS
jgi:hypothetical protein